MTKAGIRAQIAEQKKTLSPRALEEMSTEIIRKLQVLTAFKTARNIGAYMPLPDEVNIGPLFRISEKNFYIPAFDEVSGSYRMAQLTAELKKGRFGILEPANSVFAAKNELDLILVPGVAFDLSGRRIGRGGGFYDRLLPQYCAVRAGICFGFQLLEVVPAEEHDIHMDFTVTDVLIS